MRPCHGCRDIGGIDLVHVGVHGIGVGVVFGIGALGAAVHVGARDVVDLDKACLAAGSMAMLEMERRWSMDMVRMALPVNSMALYSAPSTPIMPMMCRITSLPLTHLAGFPTILNLIADGT